MCRNKHSSEYCLRWLRFIKFTKPLAKITTEELDEIYQKIVKHFGLSGVRDIYWSNSLNLRVVVTAVENYVKARATLSDEKANLYRIEENIKALRASRTSDQNIPRRILDAERVRQAQVKIVAQQIKAYREAANVLLSSQDYARLELVKF